MRWGFLLRVRDFIFPAELPEGGECKGHLVVVFCPDDHHRLWKKHFWKIFTKILKKILAIIFQDVYYIKCCDVIAVKREVAARE